MSMTDLEVYLAGESWRKPWRELGQKLGLLEDDSPLLASFDRVRAERFGS